MKSSSKGKAEGTLHQVNGDTNEVSWKITGKTTQSTVSSKESSNQLMLAMRYSEQGKIGWALLWLMGIPVPILLVLYFLRGCT